jgi:hypothetical protein
MANGEQGKPRVAPGEGIKQVAQQARAGVRSAVEQGREQVQKRLLTRQPGRRGGVR